MTLVKRSRFIKFSDFNLLVTENDNGDDIEIIGGAIQNVHFTSSEIEDLLRVINELKAECAFKESKSFEVKLPNPPKPIESPIKLV